MQRKGQGRKNFPCFWGRSSLVHLLSSALHSRYTLTQRVGIMRKKITSTRMRGISRIDQPAKRTHGFFVRLKRRGKTNSAFFADQKHGGRKRALVAAQKCYRKLLAKFGPPLRKRRRQA